MHSYVMTVACAINMFMPHLVLGLNYTVFDQKCRNGTNSLSVLTEINLDECVMQCWFRPDCMAIIFKRLYSTCEVYDVDVSTSSPVPMGTSCTIVRKHDVIVDGSEV